ncbi:hypothetical protein PRJ_5580 (plasmid) [Pseudomonas sp. XWY-1]|uniref:Uncharacterized protein n=2 Tax=Pseudomonas TaxID=286 RepID=A0A1H9HCG9_9PSED|nr:MULTISPECIES: hypothetical protein [Pseudomonas]AUA35190.1 hypothetical protein CWR53_22640 [Pseudomonas sp. SGAir0191]AUZ62138.1 hypothetical protein PRJ_5580 [Pseudomonas sp. XWY-1]MBA1207611.1 hypothetical protein [Pseudomonas fulva]MBA1215047.1 hypothetical protein [Pseudomonas fulva]MCO7059052.1 hypothetical protein [Pseudomonas juntendi]
MNDIESWAVAIGDFRRSTEKLTVQLDELASQTRACNAVLEKSNELVEEVDLVSRQIQEEVRKAEKAWSNAEEVAIRAAAEAYSAAARGVETAIQPLISELTAATKSANASILELKQAPVLAKRYVMVVATAFFILALLCVYSTMQFIEAAGSVSAQEKVNAQYFSHLWRNANPEEQKIIKSVILRSPMDPVVLRH